MVNGGPLKVMYLNPVGTSEYDAVFADMARGVKLPGTEVHVTSLKPADGAFTHIEYRSYEAVVSAGIVRRRARRRPTGSTRWPSAASTTPPCSKRARCPATWW